MPDLTRCKNIIVFGGSFDPPHIAHTQLPLLAMHAIGADAVAYVPAGLQPLKSDSGHTPAHHRLAMLRLALADQPWAAILTDEIDRTPANQPTYTVDTLESLRHRLPADTQLYLLIGADSLRTFHLWRRPQRILQLATPLVMLRPPDTPQSLLSSLPPQFNPQDWHPRIVELPRIDVSSTQIRQLVAQGKPITGLVHPAVENYIHQHHLYRNSNSPH
jgi:nicotinate-nucleotide adenylyltransferase